MKATISTSNKSLHTLTMFCILCPLLSASFSESFSQANGVCAFSKSQVFPQIFSNPIELPNVADSPEFRKVLPNIKYAWGDTITKIGILIGWQAISDTLLFGSTINQFLLAIRTTSDPLIEARRRDPMTLTLNSWIEQKQPITVYYDWTYIQNGQQYTDFAVDIYASKRCLFSIKFSGDPSYFTQENKNLYFIPEIDRYRAILFAKTGPISFSDQPLLFNPSLGQNYFMQLLLLNALTAIAFILIRKRVICTYGRIATVYSSIITGLALLMSMLILLMMTALAEWSSPLKGGYILDLSLLLPIGFVFLLHLANLLLRKNYLLQYTLLYMIISGIFGIVLQFTTMPFVNDTTLVSLMFAIGFASFVAYKTFHKPSTIES